MKKLLILTTFFFAAVICKAQLYGFNENSFPAYTNEDFRLNMKQLLK